MATTLANNWLIGLPPEFLGQYVPMIQKVTPEQVRDIGKKYFAPENQSIVVVGDKAAVGEQLKAFGEFVGDRQVSARCFNRNAGFAPAFFCSNEVSLSSDFASLTTTVVPCAGGESC